jgi:hypothetical protein
MKKIIDFFKKWFWFFKHASKYHALCGVLEKHIDKAKVIEQSLNEKLTSNIPIFTTVRSFNSENGDKAFWPWVRALLTSDEYKYLLFCLRENTIRDLTMATNIDLIHEINGRLKMLQMLDMYLTQGLTQYDNEQKAKIQRT